MTNLPEKPAWPEGIYQIETSDPVLGGPPNQETKAGLSNIPHLHLANRTLWLKAGLAELAASLRAALTGKALLKTLKEVDGAGSGLDADLLDGKQGTDFAASARKISAGTGLTGGGDLKGDRTLSASIASKAEAEAGSINTKLMTPLRVKEATRKFAITRHFDDTNPSFSYPGGTETTNATITHAHTYKSAFPNKQTRLWFIWSAHFIIKTYGDERPLLALTITTSKGSNITNLIQNSSYASKSAGSVTASGGVTKPAGAASFQFQQRGYMTSAKSKENVAIIDDLTLLIIEEVVS